VRAGMVADARDFPWSSYGHYAGLRSDPLITPHPLYWSLGNTPFAREAAYADLVRAGVSQSDTQLLTESALRGWAAGDAGFVELLQNSTDRRVVKKRPGRRPRTEAT